MANNFDTNLRITSSLGFRISGGAIKGPVPTLETLKHLWEPVKRAPSAVTQTKILRVTPNPVPTFIFPPASTSTTDLILQHPTNWVDLLKWYSTATRQTLVLHNDGSSPLTVGDLDGNGIKRSFPNGVYPVFHTTSSFVIPPGGSQNFIISYYGTEVGEYTNFLNIVSDFDAVNYKIPTFQSVARTFSMRVSPITATTTATQLGEQVRQRFEIMPVYDLIDSPDTILDFTTVFGNNNPGWGIVDKVNNTFTVRLRVLELNNVNGTYTNNVTIASEGGVGINSVVTVTNIVNVNIDLSRFQSLGSWVSPASAYNSVIGMSYDKIDQVKVLTIGVGTGGDGTELYGAGGQVFTATSTLGYLATATDYPYSGWATVYRFPLSSTGPVQHLSSATNSEGLPLYKVKSTPGLDYETAFGLESSVGSMFIVNDDGNGNVNVALNQLRDLSDLDSDFDTTLKNLTRAFHYYSNVDTPGRYYQLDSGAILDGTVTRKFIGFDNSGTVLTSIVPLPKSF